MGRIRGFKAYSDYENLRQARMLENQARLASLGLQKTISHLREGAASVKTAKPKRSHHKRVYGIIPLCRSKRIKGIDLNAHPKSLPPPLSQRPRRSSSDPSSLKQEKVSSSELDEESHSYEEGVHHKL